MIQYVDAKMFISKGIKFILLFTFHLSSSVQNTFQKEQNFERKRRNVTTRVYSKQV